MHVLHVAGGSKSILDSQGSLIKFHFTANDFSGLSPILDEEKTNGIMDIMGCLFLVGKPHGNFQVIFVDFGTSEVRSTGRHVFRFHRFLGCHDRRGSPLVSVSVVSVEGVSESGGCMWIPSGKRLHNYGKSPFSVGKSTLSMAIFNSYVSHYQRVPNMATI